MKQVDIYTDGSCWPNPGPGAYAAILVCNGKAREIGGRMPSTTNNRMEIFAAVQALLTLKEPAQVTIYSDSQYLVKTAVGDYRRGTNGDLWHELDEAVKPHHVQFQWVKGHSGHPFNEWANAVATRLMNGGAVREGYFNVEGAA